MGNNCAPLLPGIFLYSYEAEFSNICSELKQLASRFNFAYRYIDNALSINNPEFEKYLGQMSPVEIEIKDLTWINFCRSGGTVNFILPLLTNMKIPISTSQISHS